MAKPLGAAIRSDVIGVAPPAILGFARFAALICAARAR
jgi:hypothetical protein